MLLMPTSLLQRKILAGVATQVCRARSEIPVGRLPNNRHPTRPYSLAVVSGNSPGKLIHRMRRLSKTRGGVCPAGSRAYVLLAARRSAVFVSDGMGARSCSGR